MGKSNASVARHYGLDWLRIGAFASLILYHIGMFFVPWDWHIKTDQIQSWLEYPMRAVNPWRIPLLILVSGFASCALLSKLQGVGAFARQRTARLLIPLLFGVAVIIPVQPWIELQAKHGYTGSFFVFWMSTYWSFAGVNDIILPTWQHLWFVVYLLVYTLLLAAVIAVVPVAMRTQMQSLFAQIFAGWRLLALPIVWIAAVRIWLSSRFPETHALADDWANHAVLFPTFLFGFALARAESMLADFRRYWSLGAAAALGAYLARLAFEAYDQLLLAEIARSVQTWGAIVALVGLADRFLNRDHRWRPYLSVGIFPYYIIHQSIIVVTGWLVLKAAMPVMTQFAVILATTVAGCWATYELCRAVPVIGTLMGVQRNSK
jgi:glucans biosynthesis protein C